jgi:hypothetical protein
MGNSVRAVLLLGAAAYLGGCATVTSSPWPRQAAVADGADGGRDRGAADGPPGVGPLPSNVIGNGITYFLPRQLARVQLKLASEPVNKAVKALADAEKLLNEGLAAEAAATTALRAAEQGVIEGSDNREGTALLRSRRNAARDALRLAQANVGPLRQTYSTKVSELQAALQANTSFEPASLKAEIAISLQEPTADPDFAFSLSPRHSIFRDDEAQFTLTRSGLLQSSNVTATDRTGDVLVEIARIAGAATGLVPARAGGARPCRTGALTIEWMVDFADPDSVNHMNTDLECFGLHITLEQGNWQYTGTNSDASSLSVRDGIFYRTPGEVVVSIRRRNTSGDTLEPKDWPVSQQISLLLPQAGPIAVIEQDSGAFTRRNYTLAFDNGMLTSYQSNRPGEALEIARLPLRLVDGFFGGISQVVSLRTGRAEGELALVNALAELDRAGITNETQRSTALLNLLRAQGDLEEAGVNNQTEYAAALRGLVEAQSSLGNAGIVAETSNLEALLNRLEAQAALLDGSLSADERRAQALLSLLEAQNELTLAQIASPPRQANAQVEAMVQFLTAQNRQQQLESCVLNQREAGNSDISLCLSTPVVP